MFASMGEPRCSRGSNEKPKCNPINKQTLLLNQAIDAQDEVQDAAPTTDHRMLMQPLQLCRSLLKRVHQPLKPLTAVLWSFIASSFRMLQLLILTSGILLLVSILVWQQRSRGSQRLLAVMSLICFAVYILSMNPFALLRLLVRL